MGRPPCCDEMGVKKGPWTPEEDIMLVSFVQQNGAGNWRAVPSKTGLKRCSKSCRLRWTNYLRPGIKRGSFTDDEEKMIIQLQALLGNKWAAIASYLPERTDNDIKNYWNTHLKKKLRKFEIGPGDPVEFSPKSSHSISRGQWERRLQADINTAKKALEDALISSDQSNNINAGHSPPGQAFSYASSTENIARLLKDWVKKTPGVEEKHHSKSSTTPNSSKCDASSDDQILTPGIESKSTGIELSEAFESLLGFGQSYEYSSCSGLSRSVSDSQPDPNGFSVLENWLLDDQTKEYLTNFGF